MTVIATDGLAMAGDGLTLDGWDILSRSTEKVWRLEDGSLFGCCGDATDKYIFERWMNRGGGTKPDMSKGFSALVLSRNGIYLYDGKLVPISLPAPQAIGSGAPFARAAMECGKTVEEAVKIACQLSAGCGGKITSRTLNG